MGLTRFVLKNVIKTPKIENFTTYLFFGPHPDDIEIGAGATIAKLIKENKRVVFCVCTDGRYGSQFRKDLTPSKLIDLRKKEAIESANFLGVTEIYFLELSDGNNYNFDDLTHKMSEIINKVQPDIVFAPDCDVKSECHADHLNVGRALKEIVVFSNYKDAFKNYLNSKTIQNDINIKAIAFYFTNKPNRFVGVSKYINKQFDAIFKHHLSQFPPEFDLSKDLKMYLNLRSIDFGFRSFKFKAEGFKVYSCDQIHCLPEFDR